ncbi:MAG: hypothetical protein EBR82_20875 [Caulobacteraceae bacterium]|nr:hypothetical protein [Caulobacteraceae bacterium]
MKTSLLPYALPLIGSERVVLVQYGQTRTVRADSIGGPKGDPGGNAMAVGAFTAIGPDGAGYPGLNIPLGTDKIITSSYDGVRDAKGALLGGDVYVASDRTDLVVNRYTVKTANNRWFVLSSVRPTVYSFGAVPNAYKAYDASLGFSRWYGFDNTDAFRAAADYVRSNFSYKAPGIGYGSRTVSKMRLPAGQWLIKGDVDWTFDGGYGSGAGDGTGAVFEGDGFASIIIADLTDAWPAIDAVGHRNFELLDMQIRIPRTSKATCGLLLGQAYTTHAQQNYPRVGADIVLDDAEAPLPVNFVRSIVVQNSDGLEIVGTPLFLGGGFFGYAPPLLHKSAVISATADTIKLDAATMADPKCIGKSVIIIKGPNADKSGGGWKKVRRITGINGAGEFTLDKPWTVDATANAAAGFAGYGMTESFREDGTSIPTPACIAEVTSVASRTRLFPGIQANQTFYNLGMGQYIGPCAGVTIRGGFFQVRFAGALATEINPGLAGCAVLIAPAYSRMWGELDGQLTGDLYTEHQGDGRPNFDAIKTFATRVQVDLRGYLNVKPRSGSVASPDASYFADAEEAQAWAWASNTGTGAIALAASPIGAGCIPGDYTITALSATTFSVKDTFGNARPNGVVGTPYVDQVCFTLSGVPAVGDGFTVDAYAGQYDSIRGVITSASDAKVLKLKRKLPGGLHGLMRAKQGLGTVPAKGIKCGAFFRNRQSSDVTASAFYNQLVDACESLLTNEGLITSGAVIPGVIDGNVKATNVYRIVNIPIQNAYTASGRAVVFTQLLPAGALLLSGAYNHGATYKGVIRPRQSGTVYLALRGKDASNADVLIDIGNFPVINEEAIDVEIRLHNYTYGLSYSAKVITNSIQKVFWGGPNTAIDLSKDLTFSFEGAFAGSAASNALLTAITSNIHVD